MNDHRNGKNQAKMCIRDSAIRAVKLISATVANAIIEGREGQTEAVEEAEAKINENEEETTAE